MNAKKEALKRKGIPAYSGFIKYFPRAILEVAKVSQEGSNQHHPGEPVHWDRAKSSDELDALTRHLIDNALGILRDSDKRLHLGKVAWRAMAELEKLLEKIESEKGQKRNRKKRKKQRRL